MLIVTDGQLPCALAKRLQVIKRMVKMCFMGEGFWGMKVGKIMEVK